MKVTLSIPEHIYERARQAAREEQCTVSEFLTEAVVMRLAQWGNRKKSRFSVKPVSMGKPRVPVHNRAALYGCMEADKGRLPGDASSS